MAARIAAPRKCWTLWLGAQKHQTIVEAGDDEGADQRADHRAGPTRKRGAADHGGGDGEQGQIAAAGIGPRSPRRWQ